MSGSAYEKKGASGLGGDEAGLISLVTVLVIAGAAVAIGLAFSTHSLAEQQHAYFDESSNEAFYAADSCIEESYLRLKRDSGYAGGTLAVGGSTCRSAVVAAGSGRTVTASSTVQGFSRKIVATTTLQGATLRQNDWNEYDGF